MSMKSFYTSENRSNPNWKAAESLGYLIISREAELDDTNDSPDGPVVYDATYTASVAQLEAEYKLANAGEVFRVDAEEVYAGEQFPNVLVQLPGSDNPCLLHLGMNESQWPSTLDGFVEELDLADEDDEKVIALFTESA